jgi:hypothetical protein
MNKEFWKTVNRWLESATLDELQRKQRRVRRILGRCNDPGIQALSRKVLRTIDHELTARAELAAHLSLTS